MAEKELQQEKAKKQRQKAKKRRKRKKILLIFEGIFLLLLCAGVYVALKWDRLDYTPIPKENIIINEKVKENENLKEYTNIALFGIDSRDESLGSGNRSDTMMIASINNKTYDVKLISVYRDSYLLIPRENNISYDKANLAYSYGGPEMTINLMNTNLDLDITDYVAVNFSALIDTIDLLGGIDIEINEYEREYINGYMTETSKITGKEIVPLYESGQVHLNGIQATAYCRIRQTAGDDYRRTERQRLVIQKLAEKAQKADVGTLNKIIDKVLPNISTSLDPTEIAGMALNASKYNLVANSGFPFEKEGKDMGKKGDCVIPVNLEANVIALHEYLFGDTEYKVSKKVKEISEKVKEDSGIKGEDVSISFGE